jgi:hypothetical protein
LEAHRGTRDAHQTRPGRVTAGRRRRARGPHELIAVGPAFTGDRTDLDALQAHLTAPATLQAAVNEAAARHLRDQLSLRMHSDCQDLLPSHLRGKAQAGS